MAFETLSERLQSALKSVTRKGKLTEKDVDVMMREVRLALLEADVNIKVVREFINEVKEKAVGEAVLKSLTPGQQVIKIVNEELTVEFGETEEGKWVAENAHRFGFIIRYPEDKTLLTGYQYEPWHLRYVGIDAATEIYENGWILEEYILENNLLDLL
jgi:23S rRNA C2498 (ribose-2'-O)-methylase RlmM